MIEYQSKIDPGVSQMLLYMIYSLPKIDPGVNQGLPYMIYSVPKIDPGGQSRVAIYDLQPLED